MSTLEMFLEANHPDILEQYKCYIRKDELPKIGVTVKTLRGGFGDWKAGRILRVKGYGYKGQKDKDGVWGDDYIVLSAGGRDEYLSKMKDWWNDFVIESE